MMVVIMFVVIIVISIPHQVLLNNIRTAYGIVKLFTLLDSCVSSFLRGHASILCIDPILTDDPRRESSMA